MARAMTPATEIRNLKRELRSARAGYQSMRADELRARIRATKAEQEAAEWKRRFDALLLKLPDVPKETP